MSRLAAVVAQPLNALVIDPNAKAFDFLVFAFPLLGALGAECFVLPVTVCAKFETTLSANLVSRFLDHVLA